MSLVVFSAAFQTRCPDAVRCAFVKTSGHIGRHRSPEPARSRIIHSPWASASASSPSPSSLSSTSTASLYSKGLPECCTLTQGRISSVSYNQSCPRPRQPKEQARIFYVLVLQQPRHQTGAVTPCGAAQ